MDTEIGRRSLRERQRQEREELILRAAEEVVLEKGYREMSMDEIAARVGIAKGTVYLHFASKEELVFALFERDMRKFLTVVETTNASSMTPHEKLATILRYMYGGLFNKGFQLLHGFVGNAASRDVFVAKKEDLKREWRRLAEYISAIIDEGKETGEFDRTLPTPVLLSMFFSLLSPPGYRYLVMEKQMQPDELVAYLERAYFKCLAAHKG
jgi:TetR/AcrR family transcriptional regulator, fatty acid metabolism regulator protein